MDIKTFLEFNESLPDNQARLIMGPAGIGKSAMVKMIADKLGYDFIDLRLSELEPADLVGLPYLVDSSDGKEKLTKYAQPWWWPESGKTVLFLDEVDRCREDMQPIAMQLTLDRRAGGRNLPDGVLVFAACNGEKYMTSSIDQALFNRFAGVELTPSPEEWLSWAEKSGVHSGVISFIRAQPNALDTPEKLIGAPNQAVPTRRSWTNLGMFMNNLEKKVGSQNINNTENMHNFAAAFVGMELGVSFASWLRENYSVLSPDDIFRGRVDGESENYNIVQVSNVVQEVADRFLDEDVTLEMQGNCLRFFMKVGHEAFAALFSALDRKAAFVIEKFDDVDAYIREHTDKIAQYATSTEDSDQ